MLHPFAWDSFPPRHNKKPVPQKGRAMPAAPPFFPGQPCGWQGASWRGNGRRPVRTSPRTSSEYGFTRTASERVPAPAPAGLAPLSRLAGGARSTVLLSIPAILFVLVTLPAGPKQTIVRATIFLKYNVVINAPSRRNSIKGVGFVTCCDSMAAYRPHENEVRYCRMNAGWASKTRWPGRNRMRMPS